MLRATVYLGWTAFVAGDQETGGAAIDRTRGRIVRGNAGSHFRRLLGIGKDLLARRLEAARKAGEGSAGAQHLQDAAARCFERRLLTQLTRRLRPVRALAKAAPWPHGLVCLCAGDGEL